MIYLDSAATTLTPQVVIDRMTRYYEQERSTIHRGVYRRAQANAEAYQQTRVRVAQFLGCEDREVVFTKGTTEAINLVAASYGREHLSEGDEIIISEMEHHANIVPWVRLAEEKGCVLKVIPVLDSGELDLEVYASLLSSNTKLVCVVHVSNVLGTINPVKKITDMAHAVGAVVLIDGAQAVAHVPLEAIGCDFYAFSGHKIYGPTGIGVLYGRYDLLEKMPPYQGGGDMIDQVSFEKITYQKPPLRFEAGTPAIAEVLGLGEAIDYYEQAEKNHELIDYLYDRLSEVASVLGPKKRASVVSFSLDGAHPLDIATMLDIKGVAVRSGHMCAQPLLRRFGYESLVRMSIGLYTTKEEIDAAVEALATVRPLVTV